jgi:hypothetical protein
MNSTKPFSNVMAGHSRSKNGVAEFTLGLAEGKTRGLAYVPAIHAFLLGTTAKTWMPATRAGMTVKAERECGGMAEQSHSGKTQ